uniref:Uncharacterized protein n=1 Tax=Parastrongyloides trichosuri TaxID=131310 RepID=A0A0N4Z9A4_PARTI
MLSYGHSLNAFKDDEFQFYQEKNIYLEYLKLRKTQNMEAYGNDLKLSPLTLNALCNAPVRPNIRRSKITPNCKKLRKTCLFPLSSSSINKSKPAASGDADDLSHALEKTKLKENSK